MDESIKFFGKVDRDATGKITSEYPCYYRENDIDELKEELGKKERALERGDIPSTRVPMVEGQVKRERAKLNEILKSIPKLKGAQKDKVAKLRTELGKEITEAQFTRSEMRGGRVDPHKEVRRMTEPSIKVDPDVAKEMGVKVVNGKVSRKGAEKMWKILGKVLGEETNVETLRKEGMTYSPFPHDENR